MAAGNYSCSHPEFSTLTAEEGCSEIARCEAVLDRMYRAAGITRHHRPFRFPCGDKGGENKALFQRFLSENGFSKVNDTHIKYPWRHLNGPDRDIDTFWTYDFQEYRNPAGQRFFRR